MKNLEKYKAYLETKLNDKDLTELIREYSAQKPTAILFYEKAGPVYIGSESRGKNAFYAENKGGIMVRVDKERLASVFSEFCVDIKEFDKMFNIQAAMLGLTYVLHKLDDKELFQKFKSRYLKEL